MTGEYACRSSRLHSLNWTCRKLARAVDFSIEHIQREDNCEANQLAHHAVRATRNPPNRHSSILPVTSVTAFCNKR